MTVGALGKVCDMLARAIKLIEHESAAKEREIEALKERIKKLESQPTPDPAQIHELENDIRELEDRLETLRAEHGAFTDEFAASCGS